MNNQSLNVILNSTASITRSRLPRRIVVVVVVVVVGGIVVCVQAGRAPVCCMLKAFQVTSIQVFRILGKVFC